MLFIEYGKKKKSFGNRKLLLWSFSQSLSHFSIMISFSKRHFKPSPFPMKKQLMREPLCIRRHTDLSLRRMWGLSVPVIFPAPFLPLGVLSLVSWKYGRHQIAIRKNRTARSQSANCEMKSLWIGSVSRDCRLGFLPSFYTN